jgi:heavy metal sensor kinase
VTRWWRSHTVRVRLTLWYVAAMILVLGAYVFVVYAFVSRNSLQNLDQQLRRDSQWTAATVDVDADGQVIPPAEPTLTTGEEELPWVQLWTGDGRLLLFQSNEAQRRRVPDSSMLMGLPEDERGVFASFAVEDETAPMRVFSRRLRIREQAFILQVGRSEASMRQDLRVLAVILLLGLPIAVAIAGLGGYGLARRALMPIERMTDRARHITAERLSDRLPVHNPDDEMGRLAAVFNETLARLEGSFEQMRRFTADVSHELRTPLTAIRSVGEVGLRGHRDEQAYRLIIGSMLEESDRLASLVDRLLAISRAESSPARGPREVLNLTQLAEEVAAHLGVLAEEKGQAITVSSPAPVYAMGDRVGLRQALINLVDNAIKFTPPGGAIQLIVADAAHRAVVDVVDSGPGIPLEARDRIFDRFFRADSLEKGTGLGLSIAKGAVDSSGGRLTLEQSGLGGSTFRISLPKSVAAAQRVS